MWRWDERRGIRKIKLEKEKFEGEKGMKKEIVSILIAGTMATGLMAI